jgi:hypothetical protein
MLNLLVALIFLQTPTTGIDGEQLMGVLQGLHSEIRDFELVCEGTTIWADPELRRKSEEPERHERLFQCGYAYRTSDGASYLDLYRKALDSSNAHFLHGIHANLKGNLTEIVRSSDQRNSFPGLVAEKPGGPGVLTFPCSPERFIYFYYWRRQNYSVAKITLKVEGWEEVDGHPALRVWVDEFPSSRLAQQKW